MLSGYSYEEKISIIAPATGMSAGSIIYYDRETHDLIGQGKCRPDRKDYRILYNGVEIDRIMVTTGLAAFRLQHDLAPSQSTNGYTVNYGKASESSDPAQNPHNVWNY